MTKNICNGINNLDDHLANSKKAQKNVTLHLDYEESDGMFLSMRVIDADRPRIGFNVDGSNGRRGVPMVKQSQTVFMTYAERQKEHVGERRV